MTDVMTADDFRYLGKLLDWCAGQGFCKIEGLQDPDEFAYELGNRLRIPSEDYSADALADAIARQATASSLAAENERLRAGLEDAAKTARHDERKKIIAQGCVHTVKAAKRSAPRPDIEQWQADQHEYFDATILEIVSEYAAWRDGHAVAEEALATLRMALTKVADSVTTMARETVTSDEQGEAVAAECIPVFEAIGMANDGDGWGFVDD